MSHSHSKVNKSLSSGVDAFDKLMQSVVNVVCLADEKKEEQLLVRQEEIEALEKELKSVSAEIPVVNAELCFLSALDEPFIADEERWKQNKKIEALEKELKSVSDKIAVLDTERCFLNDIKDVQNAFQWQMNQEQAGMLKQHLQKQQDYQHTQSVVPSKFNADTGFIPFLMPMPSEAKSVTSMGLFKSPTPSQTTFPIHVNMRNHTNKFILKSNIACFLSTKLNVSTDKIFVEIFNDIVILRSHNTSKEKNLWKLYDTYFSKYGISSSCTPKNKYREYWLYTDVFLNHIRDSLGNKFMYTKEELGLVSNRRYR